MRIEDEWCEIQESDLYDFLDNVRTDEITERWVNQQNQIELMIEQPISYSSILGEGSEPLGSIRTIDNNWLCCANHTEMLEDSDDDIPELEDITQNNIECDNQYMVVGSPYGLNRSPIEVLVLLEDLYESNGVSQIESNDSTASVSNDIESYPTVELRQVLVDGQISGRSRIVPLGYRVTAEYLEDESDSDDSNMPDLVTLSSSESEYFYSDDDRDSLSKFFDDHDDEDGIGLLVNDTSSDSDVSTDEDYVVIDGSDSDEESTVARCKMVVDLSQDSDSESESDIDYEDDPAPDNLVWLLLSPTT